MASKLFIGRTQELDKLKALHNRAIPALVVIKGRRRIGKSRLVAEFASKFPKHKLWNFTGLVPQEGISAQNQRDYFARRLAFLLKLPPMTFLDWSDAFEHLSLYVQKGDIVLFDEISWMGAKDSSFIPKLKAWWDNQSIAFVMVFCGSVSTWIEENILKSTAFFGRVHLTITLEALSIFDSAQLLRSIGFKRSAYDTYKLLSILGGVPWYLEQVNPNMTADSIIKQLCFQKDGILTLEFNHIFHDLFNGKGTIYKKILGSLKEGMKTLAEIRTNINFTYSGTLSKLMEHLIVAGFVKKQGLWSFKTTKPLKQSLYRICDPYMRFYLKVIEAYQSKIHSGTFDEAAISRMPGFEAHIGLQVEYLLLQNRIFLLKYAGIATEDIVCDGPYRQSKTTTTQGCQIDYLVQTFTKNLFVYEFKFKRKELGLDIIDSTANKIKALKIPRGFAVVPILCHVGGVTSSVATDGYFYRIIDIADFLESNLF